MTNDVRHRITAPRAMMLLLMSLCGLLAGCQSAYYGAWEKVGVHKREILVDRVEEARESQSEGREQFQSALEQFRTVVAFDGGELEERYRTLNAEYEASTASAERIRERIEAVDEVAGALFKEWKGELDDYDNPRLKAESERQLRATRTRYRQLLEAMESAESAIDPVLSTLGDHVLFLKHNLNARAIASLQGEVGRIDADVQRLVQRMQEAIDEADRFLAQLRQDGA